MPLGGPGGRGAGRARRGRRRSSTARGSTRRVVERSLRELQRVNRLLFGYRPVLRTLLPRLAADGVGEAARRRGGAPPPRRRHRPRRRRPRRRPRRRSARPAGRRWSASTASWGICSPAAVSRGGLRVVADARALPFADRAVDWSLSSLFFHHFGAGDNRRILSEMRRVTPRAPRWWSTCGAAASAPPSAGCSSRSPAPGSSPVTTAACRSPVAGRSPASRAGRRPAGRGAAPPLPLPLLAGARAGRSLSRGPAPPAAGRSRRPGARR